MRSVWGIEHGTVAKAYVPRQGWIPTSKLTKLERAQQLHDLRRGKVHKPSSAGYRSKRDYKNPDPEQDSFRQAAKELRSHAKELRQGGGRVKPVPGRGRVSHIAVRNEQVPFGINAYAFATGSAKGGQRYVVVPPGASKNTIDHEMAHAKPDRSGYRMWQITRDPDKTMREEARADYTAGSFYRGHKHKDDSGYVEAARSKSTQQLMRAFAFNTNPDIWEDGPVQGYRTVQDAMHAARRGSVPALTTRTRRQRKQPSSRTQVIVAGSAAGGVAAGADGVMHRWQENRVRRDANGKFAPK